MESNIEELVFWGAGIQGELALRDYKCMHLKERLIGFMDSHKEGNYLSFPIIKPEQIAIEEVYLVITVGSSRIISDIYHNARKLGFKKIYWYTGYCLEREKGFLKGTCLDCSDWGDLLLPQAEMHVADFCNLNCKGCAHFSPIFERKLPNTDSRINDIKMLKDKFSHIIKFYLLGGEPFLNTDIMTYITESRKILPNTMIQIVTNGLLIPRLEQKVLDAIRENQIIISISEYEPTHRIIDKIEDVLTINGIIYTIRPYNTKDRFIKPLSLVDSSKYPQKCISNGCINIWNGKISRCPTLMYIDKFNSVFNTSLPNDGIYKLEDVDGKAILELILKKVPLCKHCVDNEIAWGRCNIEPDINDFAVDE